MAKVMDCSLEVNEFEPLSYYYFHFLVNYLVKIMDALILPAIGYVIAVLLYNVWFGFMAYQTLKVIQCQTPFYPYKQFYFKQDGLA